MEKNYMPSFTQALICFGGIIMMVVVGLIYFEISIHVIMTICIVWTCCNMVLLGYGFKEIKFAMSEGIKKGLSAFYIFFLIGLVIAAFIESGTIASIVFYSLDLIHPAVFLPVSVLICSFMSVALGTSWGTAGTAGIVLIGIGSAIGIPLPLVAGAIVSGATFGDKLSPVSDTTNLAAAASGTDLYKHITSMLYTTIPTYVITLILFTIIGLNYSSGALSSPEIISFQQAIDENFIVSFWTFIPIIVLLALSLNKVSAEPAMMASVLAAIIIAILIQDRPLLEIFASLQDGYSVNTNYDALNTLVNRGGIQSMMWTLSLTMIALALGGLLEFAKYLVILLEGLLAKIKSALSLTFTTMCTGFLACMSMGDSYISIIVTSQLFKVKYAEMKLEKYMLSRTVEESTTIICPIIPWTSTGAFYFGALGVPVLDYLPFAFLNYLNPIVSLIFTYFGYAIFKLQRVEK